MRFLGPLIELALVLGAITLVVVLVGAVVRILSAPRQPPAVTDGVILRERATALGPQEHGPGELRLTSTQLVFAADSGRVSVLERADIVGAGHTRHLPDRELAHPVLVVTAGADPIFFAVTKPQEWAATLT